WGRPGWDHFSKSPKNHPKKIGQTLIKRNKPLPLGKAGMGPLFQPPQKAPKKNFPHTNQKETSPFPLGRPGWDHCSNLPKKHPKKIFPTLIKKKQAPSLGEGRDGMFS